MMLWLEKIIFYALIFCLPLQARHIFYSFSQTFNEWLSLSLFGTDLLVLALLWLWFWRSGKKLFNQERRSFSWQRSEIWLAGFLLVSLLSVVLADNRWLGFYGWLRLIELTGLFLYVKNNLDKIFNIKIFWQIYVAGATLQGLVALGQFFKQQGLGLKWLGESPLSPSIDGVAKIVFDGEKNIRAYGLTPHPNILAAILIVAIFGLAWLFIFSYFDSSNNGEGSKSKRFFGLLGTARAGFLIFPAAFIILASLFFTFSRSVIAVGGILFLFWLFSLWRKKELRKKTIFIFLLLMISYVLLAAYYWPLYASRFSADNLVNNQSVNLRVFYNQVALETIKENPLFGIGRGNFVNNFSQHYLSLEPWVFQPVHNVYLLIASEAGLLGLFIFFFFLFSVFRGALKKKQLATGNCFFYIFCFIMLVGLTDHFWWDLQQGQLLFWLMLGFLSAHSSMDRAQASEA